MSTPIRIKKDAVEELKRLKFHSRETHSDVVKRLIEAWRKQTHS